MVTSDRTKSLLVGFVLLSLLIHGAILYLLPQGLLLPEPPAEEPVYVEVRPAPPETRERELDLPATPDQPREEPAKRLGPSDQVVEKETAPRGDAPEDRRPDAPAPAVSQPEPAQIAPPPPAPERPKEQLQPTREPAVKAEPTPERPQGKTGPPPQPQAAQPSESMPQASETRPMPDLKSLLQLPETTVARLEEQWRRKYRSEVEEGDAVWLDTERDVLISFFQRFRTNVYAAWNYPARARDRGQEGTCLLKITVNRDGTLQKVELMESSGHPILDEEAVAAVRKGAPFGDLPKAYEGDELNIFAFFNYNLTRRFIY